MAMEFEVADVGNISSASQPGEGAIAAGLDAATIVNGDGELKGVPQPQVSQGEGTGGTESSTAPAPSAPSPDDISSSLVESATDESVTTSDAIDTPPLDESEQKLLAERAYEIEISSAKEEHFTLAVNRSNLEAELKDAKADEKAALKNLKNLLRRGPNYTKPVSKVEEAIAQSEPSAIQVDDANADTTWKQIPTSQIIDGIKGMGAKKAAAIIDLAPTLGDLEELRAAASLAHKQFKELLPKGVGSAMADEMEERILTVIGKHCAALESAGDVAAEVAESAEAEVEAKAETEAESPSQPEGETVEAVEAVVSKSEPTYTDVTDL